MKIANLLPKIMGENICMFRRVQEFDHAYKALVEELSDEDEKLCMELVSNYPDNFYDEIPESIEDRVKNWVLQDKWYYIEQLAHIIESDENSEVDGDGISFENFRDLIMFPDFLLPMGPGGMSLSSLEWVHIFFVHDFRNPDFPIWRTPPAWGKADFEGGMMHYLRFMDMYENAFTSNESREKYLINTYSGDKDISFGICVGALEFYFVTNEDIDFARYFINI